MVYFLTRNPYVSLVPKNNKNMTKFLFRLLRQEICRWGRPRWVWTQRRGQRRPLVFLLWRICLQTLWIWLLWLPSLRLRLLGIKSRQHQEQHPILPCRLIFKRQFLQNNFLFTLLKNSFVLCIRVPGTVFNYLQSRKNKNLK